jgi:hypothetical protein
LTVRTYHFASFIVYYFSKCKLWCSELVQTTKESFARLLRAVHCKIEKYTVFSGMREYGDLSKLNMHRPTRKLRYRWCTILTLQKLPNKNVYWMSKLMFKRSLNVKYFTNFAGQSAMGRSHCTAWYLKRFEAIKRHLNLGYVLI